MEYLSEVFSSTPEFKKLCSLIDKKTLPAALNGLSHIHKALLVSALVKRKKKAVLICSDESECAKFSEDLSKLGCQTLMFPYRDFTLKSVSGYSKEYEHKRTGTLSRLLDGDFSVLLFSVDAAMQRTVPPEMLERHIFILNSGDTLEREELISRLVSGGYTRCDMVEGAGQFAARGSIVDVFPPDRERAVRIDFWGDEIDKISEIDAESQRSVNDLQSVKLAPAAEVFCESEDRLISEIGNYIEKNKKLSENARKRLFDDLDSAKNGISLPLDRYLPFIFDRESYIFDYIGKAEILVSESLNVAEKVRTYTWQMSEDIKQLFEDGSLSKGLDKLIMEPSEFYGILENGGAVFLENFARSSYEVTLKAVETFSFQQSSFWSGSVFTLIDDLSGIKKGSSYVVLAGGEKAAKNLARELSEAGINAQYSDNPKGLTKGVTVMPGGLSAGFYLPSIDFTLITQGGNFAPSKKYKTRRKDAKPYGSLEELHKGDYVVHASHGIGIFDGINTMSVGGIKKDYIKIKYSGQDVLYVPVTQLDLVSKYIGPREDGAVRLHKLGGSEWSKTRQRVRKAVKDMAKQLTVLYAKRMQTKGYSFPEDDDLQSDFESRFQYEETDDQLRCAREIKEDMQRPVPMDRLLCGDVGFGKTEVALRAAFKCIADGRQCAILVPTTILAFQHYNTATARMGTLPVNVEMISRFRTKKQQTEILKRLKSGDIDILVGTHRLISKDVTFRDLGLVIIDEEQRFGVEQKEKLKELFPAVDVLTLSATPIPRTLNMAMSGLRDMSVIEEAPGDRHPVQTYVLEQDDGILLDAISRELRRGGQVYYLHNRVESIEAAALRLQSRLPDARIAVAHGKMDEATLSRVWKRLLEHEIDILVCTTIIETGVDVPNANTLIIEDADRMGLSQLHQLRGRVGRSPRRAYAYLCFRRGKALSDIATKRLNAVRDFTEFGSGFKIAMRDLEIRGAGSILGGEQHGHMEAVGYDMYLKLLADAISEEKGEAPSGRQEECLVDISIPAHIPEDYIPSLPQRLGIYRRIADIKTAEDKEDVIDELIDRFGEPPKSVLALTDISMLRTRAANLGVTEIAQREKSLLIYIPNIASEPVANLCSSLKGRAMLSAGNKPYVAVRVDKSKDILENIYEILNCAEGKK